MIRCIIVEDEYLATVKLSKFISRMDILHLQSIFDNGADAVSYLVNNETDLVFLDIQIHELDGIQLLKALAKRPRIIITSAETSHAVVGYEYNVSDYLLKPFSFDRFVKAVTKVANELDTRELPDPAYIFVKTEYRSLRIDLNDIRYIEGMKDYLRIVLANDKIMTLMSFNDMLQLLPCHRFLRVHKSYIVALNNIQSIEKNRLKVGDALIPVSDTYREAFMTALKAGKHMI